MRLICLLSFAIGLAMVTGCGGTSDTGVATSENATAAAADQSTQETTFQPQRPAKTYAEPIASMQDFLSYVRNGDDKSATALLTTAAQKEAWSNGLVISNAGFSAAEFQLTEVEYLKENTEARVMCIWENEEASAADEKQTQCLWFLRREPHGWCVYGMALKFLPHLDPVWLNFENQAEMTKNGEWAQNEIRKHRTYLAQKRQQMQQQQQMPNGTPANPQQQGVRQANVPQTNR